MTKVMFEGFGWIYIILVLDWYSKKIVGHYAGIQGKAKHWLEALNTALNHQFPNGIREQLYPLNLMSDNGSQPTSASFMKTCSELGINQAFTSYNNPKGNADTERVIRTLKEELVWTNEWRSPKEFFDRLAHWIEYYNEEYLHSSLQYKTPAQFEIEANKILLAVA
jgi:transposase InsO family protein